MRQRGFAVFLPWRQNLPATEEEKFSICVRTCSYCWMSLQQQLWMLVTILLWLIDMTHHLVYTQDWEVGTRASGQSVPYQKVASARQTMKIRSFGHPSTMQIVQQPALGLCSHVCHILPVLHVIFVCMPNINILMTKFSKPQQNISGRIRDGCRWPLGTYIPGCLCPEETSSP